MLFEAWCGPALILLLPPCGRPALRSLGCLCGSAARGDGVGLSGTRRGAAARLREPGFHAQRRCPSGFVFV